MTDDEPEWRATTGTYLEFGFDDMIEDRDSVSGCNKVEEAEGEDMNHDEMGPLATFSILVPILQVMNWRRIFRYCNEYCNAMLQYISLGRRHTLHDRLSPISHRLHRKSVHKGSVPTVS